MDSELRRRSRLSLLLAGALTLVASACTTEANFLEPEGPRFAADYWGASAVKAASEEGTLKVVSYNLRYGRELGLAIDELTGENELADADVVLLQEMHSEGVDRIAQALGASYVFYPASLRTWGLDFGNAVLVRGQILQDHKVLLPHRHPINRQSRAAVGAQVVVDGCDMSVFSVHTEMPLLSLSSRCEQLETLLDATDKEVPCLVAGDFNTLSPRSLARFERVFADRGFERASHAAGATWGFGPFRYPLDHVFVRGFEVVDAGTFEDASASDHVPVWVELAPSPSALPTYL